MDGLNAKLAELSESITRKRNLSLKAKTEFYEALYRSSSRLSN